MAQNFAADGNSVPHWVQCLTAGDRLAAAYCRQPSDPKSPTCPFTAADRPGIPFWHPRWSYRNVWVRLRGPVRVAVQSRYEPPEDTETIQNSSFATHHRW